jgi:hypothetical protein
VRLPRFAVIGAVGVVVLTGGAFYLFDRPAAEAPPAPARQAASMPRSEVTNLDDTPDEALTDRAFHLIGQARRLADRGKFAEATAKLDEAEKALAEAERLKPQAPEIAELRQAMQAMQQKEARRSSQVSQLLTAMRSAIARKDIAGADRAFNEAARIDVLDPALDEARTELAHAHEAR